MGPFQKSIDTWPRKLSRFGSALYLPEPITSSARCQKHAGRTSYLPCQEKERVRSSYSFTLHSKLRCSIEIRQQCFGAYACSRHGDAVLFRGIRQAYLWLFCTASSIGQRGCIWIYFNLNWPNIIVSTAVHKIINMLLISAIKQILYCQIITDNDAFDFNLDTIKPGRRKDAQ
jgi:hypothetical protein